MQYIYCERAEQYVDDVLSGRRLECRWIRLACERHRRDMERVGQPDWPFYFDFDKAERLARFVTPARRQNAPG